MGKGKGEAVVGLRYVLVRYGGWVWHTEVVCLVWVDGLKSRKRGGDGCRTGSVYVYLRAIFGVDSRFV